jgi:hypothetical protein
MAQLDAPPLPPAAIPGGAHGSIPVAQNAPRGGGLDTWLLDKLFGTH